MKTDLDEREDGLIQSKIQLRREDVLSEIPVRRPVGESTLIDLICFSWVPCDFFLIMRSHRHNLRKKQKVWKINGRSEAEFFNDSLKKLSNSPLLKGGLFECREMDE
jgi:hypothetical protein